MDSLYFPSDFQNLITTDYVFFIKPNPPEQVRESFDHDEYLSKKRVKNDLPIKWFSENKTALFCHNDYFDKTPYFDEPIGPDPDNSECFKICFEEVSRRSFYPNILSMCQNDELRWVFNPTGPTGLRGRGVLEKWGVNHFAHLVITRWKKNAKYCACVHTRDMRPVLETLVYKCNKMYEKKLSSAEEYFLPNCSYVFGKDTMYDICSKIIREIFPKIEDETIEKLFLSIKKVFYGYLDDKRNTDNAWIETQCFNIHDENDLLDNLEINNKKENYTWKLIDSNEKYFTGLDKLVKRAAKYNGAHF